MRSYDQIHSSPVNLSRHAMASHTQPCFKTIFIIFLFVTPQYKVFTYLLALSMSTPNTSSPPRSFTLFYKYLYIYYRYTTLLMTNMST
jgi:hypothetical protein